jgi:hypothetical protein
MTQIIYYTLDEAAALFNSPAPIISDYERERLAQCANYERLRRERIEREATAVSPRHRFDFTPATRWQGPTERLR